MWYKYRKFTSIDEARCWGKRFYSYWLPNYQLGGKLRGNYDTENPERFLKGKFSEEEKQVLLKGIGRLNNFLQHRIEKMEASK